MSSYILVDNADVLIFPVAFLAFINLFDCQFNFLGCRVF